MRNKLKEHIRMKLFRMMNQRRMTQTNEHDKKIYSQNGEDGFLMYLFDKIGTTTKRFVEIGIEDGTECNTRNLVENFGWSGIMIEGNKELASKAITFYKKYPVTVYNNFVTTRNINYFLEEGLDLLSIDVDSIDWWLWESVHLKPRVVLIEYNSSFGEKSITVPHTHTERMEKHPDWLYHGASLNAMIKLSKGKGYKLVYANGTNAIFVREDIKEVEEFTFKMPPENFGRRRWGPPDKQFSLIKDREYITV